MLFCFYSQLCQDMISSSIDLWNMYETYIYKFIYEIYTATD